MSSPARQTESSAIRDRLRSFATEFDEHFSRFLTTRVDVPTELMDAIRYSALAPGKRLRPFLVINSCEAVGGQTADAWPAAAAVECVHAFSLIHDDLPAMDNDDLRRGQPTCHKRFGEAIAVLAGDALLTLAFEILAEHVADRSKAIAMIGVLARATGRSGMIGGQAADMIGQNQPPTMSTASYIHERKTASLFAAACRLGGTAGDGDRQQIKALEAFGYNLGKAFQIADDLLDVTSSSETLGKNAGKDSVAGKQTFPACVGIEESRQAAEAAKTSAIAELAALSCDVVNLRLLADYVVDRNY